MFFIKIIYCYICVSNCACLLENTKTRPKSLQKPFCALFISKKSAQLLSEKMYPWGCRWKFTRFSFTNGTMFRRMPGENAEIVISLIGFRTN